MWKYLQRLALAAAGADARIESSLKEIKELMATGNSAIQQFAAKVEANFTTLKGDLGNLKTGIAALDAKIIALQNSAGGALSADDQAALQGLVDDSSALVKQADAIDVTPPAPPTV